MPHKVNFTKRAIEALKPPAAGRLTVFDERTPGLCLMFTAAGSRVFYLYRKVDGRPVRIRVGGYPAVTIDAARRKAAELLGDIARGKNPQAEKRAARAEATLGELWEAYQRGHAEAHCTARTRYTDTSRWETCLVRWKGRKLADISVDEVNRLHQRLGNDRGHLTANRACELLRRLYNFAKKQRGYRGDNPAAYFTAYREQSRDRFLRADELPAFFTALESEPTPTMQDFFALALWTGARRANLQAARWADIDLTRSLWTVPAESAKAKKKIAIHLSRPAMDILTRRRAVADKTDIYVFPGTGKSGHLQEVKKAWAALLKRAGIADLHVHDLRRTLGSWQAAGGSSLQIIGASLGHQSIAATSIYSRLDLEPVRQSVDAAADAILKAAAGGKQGGQ